MPPSLLLSPVLVDPRRVSPFYFRIQSPRGRAPEALAVRFYAMAAARRVNWFSCSGVILAMISCRLSPSVCWP